MSVEQEPTTDSIGQPPENQSITLSPIEKLKKKIDEAAKSAAQKKEDEAIQEEFSKKKIKEYRELIEQRTRTKQELEERNLEFGKDKDIDTIERKISEIEPKLKATEAIEFEGKLEETRNNLAELKEFINKTYLESDAKKLLIETLGGGEHGQTEYNKLYQEAQQTQLEVSATLDKLGQEYQKWSEEIKEIIEPIKNELQISEEEYPASPKEIDRFLKLLGEKINSHKELAAKTQELSEQLEKIDDKIIEILDNPEVVGKIFNVAEQEIELQDKFINTVENKYNPYFTTTELDKKISRDLAEKFFSIEVEQYGLNNPEMTIGERQEKIKELAKNIEYGFREAEKILSITQYLDKEHTKSYSTEEWKQMRNAAFLSQLINNPEGAHYIYDFEYLKVENPGRQPDTKEKEKALNKRLRPYLPLLNIIKAAYDAQKSLGLSNKKIFNTDYSLQNITHDNYGQVNYFNIDHYGSSQALVEKNQGEIPTQEEIQKKQELTNTYQETLKKYRGSITEYKNQRITEAKEIVKNVKLELENADKELLQFKSKKEKISDKLELAKRIDFPSIWNYSDKIQDLIKRRNEFTNKLNGTFGLLSKLRGDKKVLAAINLEIEKTLENLFDYKNSSRVININLNFDFQTFENIEKKRHEITQQIYNIKLELNDEQRMLEDSISKTQEKIRDKEDELRRAKSSVWYEPEEK